jgi:hypothetical protein
MYSSPHASPEQKKKPKTVITFCFNEMTLGAYKLIDSPLPKTNKLKIPHLTFPPLPSPPSLLEQKKN